MKEEGNRNRFHISVCRNSLIHTYRSVVGVGGCLRLIERKFEELSIYPGITHAYSIVTFGSNKLMAVSKGRENIEAFVVVDSR